MPRSIWLLIYFIISLTLILGCQNRPYNQPSPDAEINGAQPDAVQTSTVAERIDQFIENHPELYPEYMVSRFPSPTNEDLAELNEIIADATHEEHADLLIHGDRLVHSAAYNLSYGMGAEIAPYLVEYVFSENNTDERGRAISSMIGFGTDAESVVPDLVAHLEDENDDFAWSAAYCLVYIDPDNQDAIDYLKDRFQRIDGIGYRRGTLRALSQADLPADEWIPFFIDLLDDEDEDISTSAAWKLGEYGPLAEDALPKIREMRDSTDNAINRDILTQAIALIEG